MLCFFYYNSSPLILIEVYSSCASSGGEGVVAGDLGEVAGVV